MDASYQLLPFICSEKEYNHVKNKKQITSNTEAKRGIAHERFSKLKERVETSDI